MNNGADKALKDFDELVNGGGNRSIQEFINTHRYYCRMVAVQAKVKYLSLLIDDYYSSSKDDRYKFLNGLYENRDLVEEDK